MEKNFLDKIYGNMNYNTYNAIQSIAGKSAVGLVVVKNFLLNNYPVAPDVAYALSWVFLAYYLGNNIANNQTRTKDVKEITSIYDEIITNYNKLNKVFDLNNPVEIYTMYNYMVYKGYLSKDKTFEFSAKNSIDIKTLFGANIINGQGVCRHIAIMLRDIFNAYGINSSVVSVTTPNSIVTIHTDDEKTAQTIEEMHDFVRKYINNEDQRKMFTEIIQEYGAKISLSYRQEDEPNKIARTTGNHLITQAVKDGKSYILDPTQTRIYKLKENDKNFLTDDETDKIKICYGSLGLFEKFKDIKTIKSNILLPSSSLEEDEILAQRINGLCESNQDIFEQFYKNNKEMYDELSTKLMLLKKPKSIIRKPGL